jgi:hypothetical protein
MDRSLCNVVCGRWFLYIGVNVCASRWPTRRQMVCGFKKPKADLGIGSRLFSARSVRKAGWSLGRGEKHVGPTDGSIQVCVCLETASQELFSLAPLTSSYFSYIAYFRVV